MQIKNKQHHNSLNVEHELSIKQITQTEASTTTAGYLYKEKSKNLLKQKPQNQTSLLKNTSLHQMNKIETRLKSQPSSSNHFSKNINYSNSYSVVNNIIKQNKARNRLPTSYTSQNSISKASMLSKDFKGKINERFQTQCQTTNISDDNIDDDQNSFFYKEDDDLQNIPGQTVVNMIPVSPNKKHKLNNELDFFASKRIMPSSLPLQKLNMQEPNQENASTSILDKGITQTIFTLETLNTCRDGESLLISPSQRCETVANCEENLQINNQQISRKIINKSLSSVNNQKKPQIQQQQFQSLSQQQIEEQIQQIHQNHDYLQQLEEQNYINQPYTPQQLQILLQQQQNLIKQQQILEQQQKFNTQQQLSANQQKEQIQSRVLSPKNIQEQQYQKFDLIKLQHIQQFSDKSYKQRDQQSKKLNTVSNICVTQASPLKNDIGTIQHTDNFDNRRDSSQYRLRYNCSQNQNLTQNNKDLLHYYEQLLTPSRRISMNFKENNQVQQIDMSNNDCITTNNSSTVNLVSNQKLPVNILGNNNSKINVNNTTNNNPNNIQKKNASNNITKIKQNNTVHQQTNSLNSPQQSIYHNSNLKNQNQQNSMYKNQNKFNNNSSKNNNNKNNNNNNNIQNRKHSSLSYSNAQNIQNQNGNNFTKTSCQLDIKSEKNQKNEQSSLNLNSHNNKVNINQCLKQMNSDYLNSKVSNNQEYQTTQSTSQNNTSYNSYNIGSSYNCNLTKQFKYDINSIYNDSNLIPKYGKNRQTLNSNSNLNSNNNSNYFNSKIILNTQQNEEKQNQNLESSDQNLQQQNIQNEITKSAQERINENNEKERKFKETNSQNTSIHQTNSGQKSLIDTIKSNFINLMVKTFRGGMKRDQCNCDEDLVDMQTCSRAQKWLEWNYPENLDNLRALYNQIKESRSTVVDPSVLQQIKRDITRTYPHLKLFQNIQNDSQNINDNNLQNEGNSKSFGLEQLEDILYSFAAYDPQIGYVQGINFIAAHFLYHAEEYIAFWLLVNTFERFELRDIYLPNLPGLKKHSQILEKILEKIDPQLFSHLNENGIRSDMYITPWLFSQFGMMIPLKYLDMFYENMIQEGWTFFYKFIVAYILENKQEIMLEDSMGIIQILTQKNNQIQNEKYSENKEWSDLISEAKKIPIKSQDIESMINNINFQD